MNKKFPMRDGVRGKRVFMCKRIHHCEKMSSIVALPDDTWGVVYGLLDGNDRHSMLRCYKDFRRVVMRRDPTPWHRAFMFFVRHLAALGHIQKLVFLNDDAPFLRRLLLLPALRRLRVVSSCERLPAPLPAALQSLIVRSSRTTTRSAKSCCEAWIGAASASTS